MNISGNQIRRLGFFGLLMIGVVSVDSIRNLPIGAQYGMALITFYLIAGLTFFLPLLIITGFLAKRYPHTGGSYLWIEAAFGKNQGFIAVWLQWVYNVIWYPTIFAFISTTLAALISPHLENSNLFILIASLIFFWSVTASGCLGIRAVSTISTLSTLIGTLLPMALIIALAVYWLLSSHPSATPISFQALVPNKNDLDNLAFFGNILFSLVGIEVIGMHAGDVENPEKNYPRALVWAGSIILLSLILSSFALCIVIPSQKIGLLSGLIDSFNLFFSHYHLPWATELIGIAIILGGLGIASSWIIGLARGLQVASVSSNLPKVLHKLNKHRMPYVILILQAIIFTLLVSVFLLFPNINNSYWLLSNMTNQFSLLYYVLLFLAAFKLFRREKKSNAYLILILLAVLISAIGIGVGFLPPTSIVGAKAIFHYELTLCLGALIFLAPLLFFFKKRKVE